MQKKFITISSVETWRLGKILAKELRGGEIVCLVGDLGTGKTTFTQGLLKNLGAKEPYISPTFLIMKEYIGNQEPMNNKQKIKRIYHFDAYRVGSEDILDLGWEEIIADKNNVIIVEWADRIFDIIPEEAVWVEFQWISEKERKIIFNSRKDSK